MRKKFMHDPLTKRGLGLVLAMLLFVPASSFALETPSKTAQRQSLAERDADLAVVEAALQDQAVIETIEAQGFTADEVHARLAQLSPDELNQLSTQVDQLRAAGLQPPQYIWVLLGALIAVVILATIF